MDFSLSLDYLSNNGPISLDESQPQFTYLDYLSIDGLMDLDESQSQFAYLGNHSVPSNSPSRILEMDMHTTVGQNSDAESRPNTPIGPPTKTRKRKAPTLRAEAWEPLKSRILDLHITQKLSLAEVKKRIEGEFQFTAELRQYRTRISQWGRDKNVKPNEMKAIVRKRQQRRLVEDKGDLRFTVRGTAVEPQKIERWMKRKNVSESFLYAPSPAASTPSAVGCRTISEIGSPIATPSYSTSSPLYLPGTPRTLAQNHIPTAFSSPALSIASLVRYQSSSFAGQSPAPIHRPLPNTNPFAVPYLPRERIPSLAVLHATGSSDIRYRETEEVQMRRELSALEETYGVSDQRTLYYSFQLSVILRDQGRFRAAETMARQHLETLRKQEGQDEAMIHDTFQLLGTILFEQGLFADAERLFKRTFEFQKKMFGDEHPDTLGSMTCLAQAYLNRGRRIEAKALTLRAIDIKRRVLGERSRETLVSMRMLASIYVEDGHLQEAEELSLELVMALNLVLGPTSPDTLIGTNLLARVYTDQGRFEEAAEALERVTGILKQILGEWHPSTIIAMGDLACAWKGQGYGVKAFSMVETCFEMQKKVLGPNHPQTLSLLATLRNWGSGLLY